MPRVVLRASRVLVTGGAQGMEPLAVTDWVEQLFHTHAKAYR